MAIYHLEEVQKNCQRAPHIPMHCRLRTGTRRANNCTQSAVHSEQSKTVPTVHISPVLDRLYKESGKMY